MPNATDEPIVTSSHQRVDLGNVDGPGQPNTTTISTERLEEEDEIRRSIRTPTVPYLRDITLTDEWNSHSDLLDEE